MTGLGDIIMSTRDIRYVGRIDEDTLVILMGDLESKGAGTN